tara:strand:+ start:3799 stop:4137 length:339 start_codon:yes stop_codon:yes gene_type:complete
VKVNALMGSPPTETHPFTFVVLATQLVPHVQMMDSLETTLSAPLVCLVGNFMLQSKNVWKLAELATTKLILKLVINALLLAWIASEINSIANSAMPVAQPQLSSPPLWFLAE